MPCGRCVLHLKLEPKRRGDRNRVQTESVGFQGVVISDFNLLADLVGKMGRLPILQDGISLAFL
jgi:hypothetical protein